MRQVVIILPIPSSLQFLVYKIKDIVSLSLLIKRPKYAIFSAKRKGKRETHVV